MKTGKGSTIRSNFFIYLKLLYSMRLNTRYNAVKHSLTSATKHIHKLPGMQLSAYR